MLHLGGNEVVPLRDVLAIVNLTSEMTLITKEFLQTVTEEGFVSCLSDEAPKSAIITEKAGQMSVYLSSISTATLYRRSFMELT